MDRRILLPCALLWAVMSVQIARAEPPLLQIEQKSPAHCLAWSADSKILATGGQDGVIRLTEMPSGKLKGTIPTRYGVLGMAFSADGKTLAIRQVGQIMSTWNVASGTHERSGGFPNYKAHLLAFTRDGQNVVAAAYAEVVLWTINGGASGSMWNNPPAGGFAAVAADGSIAGWCNVSGQVTMQQSQPRQFGNLQVGPAQCMAFGPAAKTLAVGANDNNIYVWNLIKQQKTATLTGLKAPPKELSFSADGSTLAALTADGTQIRVWDVNRLRARRLLTNTRGIVAALELSPDGRFLATLGSDGKVLVWNVATRELELKGSPLPLTKAEMTALWKDLAHADFTKADAAWRRLAACGDNAVPLLKAQIKPISVPPLDLKRIELLISQLDHDRYAIREKANQQLLAMGELVITPLQKLLVNPPSEEARCRADRILKKVKDPELTPERLQVLEAIELLEALQTPAAKELLEEIARETLIAQFRQDALLALERMARPKEEK
jgi:WD40 repeat protein